MHRAKTLPDACHSLRRSVYSEYAAGVNAKRLAPVLRVRETIHFS